jgi:diguanylate cyclase (GGDEF)-like protein
MGGKPSGKTARKRAVRSRAADRGRAKPDLPARQKSKARTLSVASRLAAEIDVLKKVLTAAHARVAELETRVDEDPLTGLLNRRGFERTLERAIAYVRRYSATAALVYFDLDRFKPVNDVHGHAAGDWALGRVARLVAGHVRASDVVARLGGDEFVVLLWNVSARQAEEKARVIEAMIDGEAFAWGGRGFAIGLSAGATMLSADDTVTSALDRADAAMYARKRERASG